MGTFFEDLEDLFKSDEELHDDDVNDSYDEGFDDGVKYMGNLEIKSAYEEGFDDGIESEGG